MSDLTEDDDATLLVMRDLDERSSDLTAITGGGCNNKADDVACCSFCFCTGDSAEDEWSSLLDEDAVEVVVRCCCCSCGCCCCGNGRASATVEVDGPRVKRRKRERKMKTTR